MLWWPEEEDLVYKRGVDWSACAGPDCYHPRQMWMMGLVSCHVYLCAPLSDQYESRDIFPGRLTDLHSLSPTSTVVIILTAV